MKTLAGIAVLDEMFEAAQDAKSSGKPVFLSVVSGGTSCANCGDAGLIYLRMATGGPYRHAPISKEPIFTVGNDIYTGKIAAYPCPICNAKARDEQIASLLQLAGLCDSEREFQLDFFQAMDGKTQALQAVTEILNERRGWLFVHGDYGVGKTGLLKAAIGAACRMGLRACYVTAADILSEIKSTYRKDEQETEREIIQRYAGLTILAIDEIGPDRISDTQWALSVLFSVIDKRYMRRTEAATLIASNTAPAELAVHQQFKYFENRTRDGLRIKMAGKNLRGIQ